MWDSTAGQMGECKIRIKNSWSEASLKEWIDRKAQKAVSTTDESNPEDTAGSEIEPPVEEELTGGSKTEPVEDIAPSETEHAIYPEVQKTDQRVHRPAVSSDNYKGSYKKEILPQDSCPPEAAPPHTASISSLDQMKKVLIDQVKKRDPESLFCFTPGETEQIGIAFNRFGPEWLLEIFQEYLRSKTVSQVNKFHGTDLPRILKRAMDKRKAQKPKMKLLKPQEYLCPVCGKSWSPSALTYCSMCGMDLKDFDNYEEIRAHKEWWLSQDKSRKQTATG